MKKSTLKSVNGLSEILFPVEKVKVTDFACSSDYAFDVFAYPNGEKLRVNSCSDRYELVPNVEIFPKIREQFLNKNIPITERYSHIGYSRFYGQITIEDQKLAYKINGSNGDIIKPMVKIQHSYNGLTKYSITFGYYRLVCSNGLTIPVQEMNKYNLSIAGKHTSSILGSIEQLNHTLTYFTNNIDQINLAINAKFDAIAKNCPTNWEERLIEVLNATKIPIVEGNTNTLGRISSAILSEIDLFGGTVNDWLIYNGINQYINDNTLNVKTPEVRDQMDVKVFDYLLNNVN